MSDATQPIEPDENQPTKPRDLAYPSTEANAEGLTKREWLAGMALRGFAANRKFAKLTREELGDISAAQADALIVSLNQDPKQKPLVQGADD